MEKQGRHGYILGKVAFSETAENDYFHRSINGILINSCHRWLLPNDSSSAFLWHASICAIFEDTQVCF